ncbi:class A beta-lactamase-related serine hydrolase [Herbaspirillum sp. 3R11]|nr:class A beta-lactamase-related serine hydrolase [Herbaspirillum sp. 3R-3a1]TFI10104.1 class A beta-lactamase-related serine hydrolase [Herbaspirillum sp. 3R11]TFI16008.1 class A beta-lactamase-related serine hydrolase [Herbaspirillum sp. 3R-11]TFI30441.1 class A beta-lactamase-related serine hydrolase [Herbaspirillum sp. 3C11]
MRAADCLRLPFNQRDFMSVSYVSHFNSSKVLVSALLWCACQFAGAQNLAPAPVAPLTFAPLEPTLTSYLVQYKLPALAAAVVQDGRIIAAGAVGTRKVGSGIAVTVNDRFHIGSDTKAFTATLAGILVDRGTMAWTTTLGEAFPELAPKMDPDFRRITISQLLSHTSGIPADNAEFLELLAKSMFEEGNLDDLRYWTLQQWMSKPLPAQPGQPGQRFAYSNLGYTIAGAMIERVARKSWEELINEWIFDPMELKSAGLGSQATLGRVDAALGHVLVGEDIAKPFMAGPGDDNPQLIAPAGGANMSVLDFARWAGWNAGEGKRGPALLKPETLKLLHTPVIDMPHVQNPEPGTPTDGKYGLGWVTAKMDWAPQPLVFHGGSNQKNLAHIWLSPDKDFAIVVVTNIASQGANDALFAVAEKLYRQFAP